MRSSIGQKLLFLSLLLLLLPAGFPSSVFAIEFNAFWQYRQSGGEDLDTQKDFIQRYSLGVGQTLDYRPTHAITASAALGYSRSERDFGDGFQSTDQLSPTARLSLVNDIFQSQISGVSTQNNVLTSGDSRKSDWWDWTLGSTWDIPLWPNLVYTYSELNNDDGKETNSNFTANWDLLLAQLYYRYGSTTAEGNQRRIENDLQSLRVESTANFFDNRLAVNFSQRFFKSTQDVIIKDLEDGGSFEFPLEGQTASAVTDPVTGPDPEDVVLDINPQLNDGDLETVTLVAAPDQRANLGISLEFDERISAMRLFLDPLTTLTEGQALALQWSLYVRDPFDTAWELASLEVPFTYDSIEKRFELLIDLVDDEIMVVAINQADIPLDFTELEVFSELVEDSDSKNTGYLTNLGMRIQLARNLTASGNLSLDHFERDLGDDTDIKNDRRTVNGNLQWSPLPFVYPSLSFSESRYEQENRPEDISRVYSLNVATIPLPSLTVSFNTTYAERLLDDQKTFKAIRYSLNSKAVLYPDLTADWNLSYRENETLRADGSVANVNAIASRLGLNAQLYRSLYGTIITNYSNTDAAGDNRQLANTNFNLRYRPSDLLSLYGNYTTFFLDDPSTDRLSLSMNLTLMNTYKSRMELGANLNKVESTTKSVVMKWSWDISDYFALTSDANYLFANRNTYSFRVTLSMRL